jgi:iron(III) transport system substrate-binding protein
MQRQTRVLVGLLCGAALVLLVAGCTTGSGQSGESLTVYSSRTQSLVHPLLERYAKETGVNLRVKYDTSAAIVATLQEEGDNSPADVVYLGESSGLGALSQRAFLNALPQATLQKVDQRMRSGKGEWIGTSGRSKVLVYNTKAQNPAQLPTSVLDYVDPKWRGKIGWAPTHGEWQLLVTALRLELGDEAAQKWIEGIKANQPRTYPNLISIVQAAADGEIEVGFVNHYYIPRLIKERGESYGARNFFLKGGDPGSLVDVAGVAILKRSKNQATAQRFVDYMLGESAQKYFVEETYEYPLVKGIAGPVGLPSFAELNPPNIDPDKLADLDGTLRLLRAAAVIP